MMLPFPFFAVGVVFSDIKRVIMAQHFSFSSSQRIKYKINFTVVSGTVIFLDILAVFF